MENEYQNLPEKKKKRTQKSARFLDTENKNGQKTLLALTQKQATYQYRTVYIYHHCAATTPAHVPPGIPAGTVEISGAVV